MLSHRSLIVIRLEYQPNRTVKHVFNEDDEVWDEMKRSVFEEVYRLNVLSHICSYTG